MFDCFKCVQLILILCFVYFSLRSTQFWFLLFLLIVFILCFYVILLFHFFITVFGWHGHFIIIDYSNYMIICCVCLSQFIDLNVMEELFAHSCDITFILVQILFFCNIFLWRFHFIPHLQQQQNLVWNQNSTKKEKIIILFLKNSIYELILLFFFFSNNNYSCSMY